MQLQYEIKPDTTTKLNIPNNLILECFGIYKNYLFVLYQKIINKTSRGSSSTDEESFGILKIDMANKEIKEEIPMPVSFPQMYCAVIDAKREVFCIGCYNGRLLFYVITPFVFPDRTRDAWGNKLAIYTYEIETKRWGMIKYKSAGFDHQFIKEKSILENPADSLWSSQIEVVDYHDYIKVATHEGPGSRDDVVLKLIKDPDFIEKKTVYVESNMEIWEGRLSGDRSLRYRMVGFRNFLLENYYPGWRLTQYPAVFADEFHWNDKVYLFIRLMGGLATENMNSALYNYWLIDIDV